jgi:hypothetical protein
MASQVSKLNYVDGKLGAPTSGQQTTRILFHTIENPGTTTQLNFFENFQGLTPGQSNLTQNKLDSMESMVIKTLWFCQFNTSNGISQWANNEPSVVDVIVGNQTVVKALPLAFNGGVGEPFDRIHNNSGLSFLGQAAGVSGQRVLPTEIRLLTDIVIPPQVTFKVVVRSASANYGDGCVVCAIGGYGKIFSAGMSF